MGLKDYLHGIYLYDIQNFCSVFTDLIYSGLLRDITTGLKQSWSVESIEHICTIMLI